MHEKVRKGTQNYFKEGINVYLLPYRTNCHLLKDKQNDKKIQIPKTENYPEG